MSLFHSIDSKLSELAEKLNAELTKDRPDYPEVLRTFEERRIDWTEDGIHKAIIIQPTFETIRVNSTIWNFINIAWCDDAYSIKRPQWMGVLVNESKFDVIEKNIDKLLAKSEDDLKKIKMNDLL